ncbi:hypothetical protein TGRUB_234400 [Toxoplasma gondii RUB]|uniref:Transmembrane protein n=7 Tax=Toxoplasma gondii TaxID=5811 RepID=B9Q6S0_TOXGV|nr:hypothetical protein TGVEG_234400 [Toxoplasma gondii VEG]KFG37500.1 hypothetical protein TGP89_234400 [Toxoplasma gondii p89]KFG37503.1 hypothetical protein TGFOU_234400 [Toxoplasma gondii FOU]KFG58079.1 hypothetical protein TGRUB_234400 [Toxoplasma gondii RUB]KFG99697.1 hypothetical protein TGVAND_234400 [Toxoplasma gondii VAND]PUA84961.1 hypothetical protein TGBR9_234400 [Toxoplasma gondii TgCATBr9]RQX68388.1 hypothetical protein TGCAST_234400 [Toxoplasma gondii CAST]
MAGRQTRRDFAWRVALLFLAVAFFSKPSTSALYCYAAEYKVKGSFSYEGDLLEVKSTDTYSVTLHVGDVLSVWCKNAKGTFPKTFPPDVCMAFGTNCRENCTVSLAALLARNSEAISGDTVSGDAPLTITIPHQMNLATVFSFACISPNSGSPRVQFDVRINPGNKHVTMWAGTDQDAYNGGSSLSIRMPCVVAALISMSSIFGH